MQRLGQGIGDVALAVKRRRVEQARAESANAYLDHQIAAQESAQDVADKLATGDVHPDDAETEYIKAVDALPRPQIRNLPTLDQQNLDNGIRRARESGKLSVDRAANGARRGLANDQLNQAIDKLGKLAGMPGADIEGINQQGSMLSEMGRSAGLHPAEVEKKLQDFKDQNWLNHATQRAMESANSMQALKELQHDLTAKDGFYAGRLDTNKRNAVLQSVLTDQAQLQAKIDHVADRREARAAVAMNEIARQVDSGVPATAEMWAEWATVTNGTIYAADFKDMIQHENEVQEVLRMSPDQQQKYVQDRQAKIDTEGGSLRDQANVQRITTAVNKNVTLMQGSFLQYLANRTGEQVAPLDISSLANPESTEFAAQLKNRVISINAGRKQYGDQIQMHPLLPQEAAKLASIVTGMTDTQAAQAFGLLRNAAADDEAYVGMMQQIAPDAPVKALAGIRAAQQRTATLKRNTFSSDVVTSSVDVSKTMLKGENILHPGKDEKGKDGTPKVGLYLPPEATKQLATVFATTVKNSFAGSEVAPDALQAVTAYYVGAANERGLLADSSTDVNSNLVREAITAVVGEVVDVGSKMHVIAPWGMSAGEFKDRVHTAIVAAARDAKLSPDLTDQLLGLPLQSNQDGSYRLMLGPQSPALLDGHPIDIYPEATAATPNPALRHGGAGH